MVRYLFLNNRCGAETLISKYSAVLFHFCGALWSIYNEAALWALNIITELETSESCFKGTRSKAFPEAEDRHVALSDSYSLLIWLFTLLGKHLYSIRDEKQWKLSQTRSDTIILTPSLLPGADCWCLWTSLPRDHLSIKQSGRECDIFILWSFSQCTFLRFFFLLIMQSGCCFLLWLPSSFNFRKIIM